MSSILGLSDEFCELDSFAKKNGSWLASHQECFFKTKLYGNINLVTNWMGSSSFQPSFTGNDSIIKFDDGPMAFIVDDSGSYDASLSKGLTGEIQSLELTPNNIFIDTGNLCIMTTVD